MKTHTSSFKEQIKLMGKEIDSRITFGSTVLGKNDLNAVTPSYQGAILKSVMKQLDIDSNVEIPIGTILKYEFGLKVNGEYEYIDFGNYIVKEVEKQEDTSSYKITCYDKMLFSMKDYAKMPITYPITIREYINSMCNFLGLSFANRNNTFVNYNKEIPYELYLDSEDNSLGYTFRDVFDELAQVTASTICINENDEIEVRYINDTGDTIDEEFLKDVNVNFGEKFGAVNTIVLSRAGGSDKIYKSFPENLPDEEKISIEIADNQIMNFNNRDEFLPEILGKLNGLEYYLNDFSSTGITYYDICDRYNVKVGDTTYSCVMFNDEILVTQGLQENVFTEMPQETETDYTKADKTDRKINQVSLIVDKQNQMIQSIASKIADISNVITGTGSVTLEKAHEGILHKLVITGNISLIYPSNDLYPSDNLYPKIFKLQVDEKIYELDLDYLNYINSEICDEFVYENSKCYVIRRIGIDENGELYQLENEIIETKKDLIINVLENSKITLLGFGNAILTAEYLLQNQYTDVFATEAYVNSEIKQTADEINIEVAKKVNEDEVVNTINVSTEQITLKGNRVVIDSDNFKMTKEGNLTCNNGTMKNVNIDGGKITMTGAQNTKRLIIKTNEKDYIASIAPYQIVMTRNDTLNNIQSILDAGTLTVYNNKYNYNSVYDSSGFYCTFNNEFTIYGDGSNGNISCVSLTQTSLEKNKKNFEKLDNALDIIKNTDIYKYHLKNQHDEEKKHIGFVIGENYNYSQEITSPNNDGADIYSMVSVCFKAIQEQQEQIKMLKNEINQLKEMIK